MNLKINKYVFFSGFNRYECDIDCELKVKYFF